MISVRRSSRKIPNVFFYICRDYTLSVDRRNITGFAGRAYEAYFEVKLGDVCGIPPAVDERRENFTEGWDSDGLKGAVRPCFGLLLLCHNTTGVNRKNRHSLQYRDLPYASHPVAHCEEIPVPVFTEFPDRKDKATSEDEGKIYRRGA